MSTASGRSRHDTLRMPVFNEKIRELLLCKIPNLLHFPGFPYSKDVISGRG
jgi:hypothetical protein